LNTSSIQFQKREKYGVERTASLNRSFHDIAGVMEHEKLCKWNIYFVILKSTEHATFVPLQVDILSFSTRMEKLIVTTQGHTQTFQGKILFTFRYFSTAKLFDKFRNHYTDLSARCVHLIND
jgi:hypothetical protein